MSLDTIIESFLVLVIAALLSLWLFRWCTIEFITWPQLSWKNTAIGFALLAIVLEVVYRVVLV